MKCYLYLQTAGGGRRFGPYDVCDEAEARRTAQAELQRHPGAPYIDIWWDSGELHRIERTPPDAAIGDAWKSAFQQRRSDRDQP